MIADQFDAFFIDLDGVVYSGEEIFPDAVDSIARLHDIGKQLRYLTNDPRPDRQAVAQRLQNLGLPVETEEVITAGWATAQYLSQRETTTASVVGSDALKGEIREQNIEVTNDDPEVAVVGGDEHTTIRDIQRAARHIHYGSAFVGTNPDSAFPTPEGPAPSTGAIIQAVETVAGTEPTIVGKPEPLMFEMALDSLPEDAEAVVIGDNPATDILGAHQAALTGILVTDDNDNGRSRPEYQRPDATISTLTELFTQSTSRWQRPQYSWPEQVQPTVAAVIVNAREEVLLIRSADCDEWQVPTRVIAQCESINESTQTAVEEQTGYTVEVSHLTGVYSDPNQQIVAKTSSNPVHRITNCFYCDNPNEGENHNDTSDSRFFSLDNLPQTIDSTHRQWILDSTDGDSSPIIR